MKLEQVELHSELLSNSLKQCCASSVFLGSSGYSCRGARGTSRSTLATFATDCFLVGYTGSHWRMYAACGGAELAGKERAGPRHQAPLLLLQEMLKGPYFASWNLAAGLLIEFSLPRCRSRLTPASCSHATLLSGQLSNSTALAKSCGAALACQPYWRPPCSGASCCAAPEAMHC